MFITNNQMITPLRIEAMEDVFLNFKGFINSLKGKCKVDCIPMPHIIFNNTQRFVMGIQH